MPAPEDRTLAMSTLDVIACATATEYERGWAVSDANAASYWGSLPGIKRLYWKKAILAGFEAAKLQSDDPAVVKWLNDRIAEILR
jgi:hypothetical protein